MTKSNKLESIISVPELTRLEKISVPLTGIGQLFSGASNLTDFPGSEHMGDFIHVGLYSAIAGYIGYKFDDYGDKKDSKIAKKIGKYFSDVTIPLVTAAFVVGETLHDWIPLNVMDTNDIYAAIGAGAIGTFYAKYFKKSLKFCDENGGYLQTFKKCATEKST